MTGYERPDEDYQPLTWFRGYPIHATHLLVALHVFSVLFCTLLSVAAPNSPFIPARDFSTDAVIRGHAVWQVVTYAFVHPLNFNFLIGMLMLFWFGWEVERFLGRRVFLLLYGAMVVTMPVFLIATYAVTRVPLFYEQSSLAVDFGVFIAFAVIYPSVQLMFNLVTKWVALALLVFYSLLFALQLRDNPMVLPAFWATVMVAYFGVKKAGGGGGLSFMGAVRQIFPRKSTPPGVKPRLQPKRLVETSATTAASSTSSARASYTSCGELHDSIDPLLDKISKHGLASLTQGERAALERARVSLLRKERKS